MIMTYLLAEPVDRNGNPLEPGEPPEAVDGDPDEAWKSFHDRPSFEFAELLIEKMETSQGDIDHLLRIIQAKNNLGSGDPAIFADVEELYTAVDEYEIEGAGWQTFRIRYVLLTSLLISLLVSLTVTSVISAPSHQIHLRGCERSTSCTPATRLRLSSTWRPIVSLMGSGTRRRLRSSRSLASVVGPISCRATGAGRKPYVDRSICFPSVCDTEPKFP